MGQPLLGQLRQLVKSRLACHLIADLIAERNLKWFHDQAILQCASALNPSVNRGNPRGRSDDDPRRGFHE